MKRILPVLLLLTACQTDQPTVESINAQIAAREGKCEAQGYKRGTKDFYTCNAIAQQQAQVDAARGAQTAAVGAGAALTGISLLAAFSDERLKRDIVPAGEENGFHLYRFKYVWSDQEYVGVLAQEVRETRPDAVLTDASGYLKVDYRKIGVSLRTVK